MAYERITVTYDVVWVVDVSQTGDETAPRFAYRLGEFEDQGDAARALAEAGFTRESGPYNPNGLHWRQGGYLYGDIRRTLVEVK